MTQRSENTDVLVDNKCKNLIQYWLLCDMFLSYQFYLSSC